MTLLIIKIYCFNGEPKYVLIVSDRFNNKGIKYYDYFDEGWKHLSIVDQGCVNYPITPSKPKNFSLMLQYASKLSAGIPHVRTDFYLINGEVYFGEMTFFDSGGYAKYEPSSWDSVFGNKLTLDKL